MCGGTGPRSQPRLGRPGLSPRVRGNQPAAEVAAGAVRSIPACAGEPRHAIHPARPRQVYPRVCGGTQVFHQRGDVAGGLSPRVRGNRGNHHHHCLHQRSIPACAGEPHGPRLGGATGKVYPRVCGGTRRRGEAHHAGPGLSPRVRGNHGAGVEHLRCAGSIPACAGEPGPEVLARAGRQVYPRVCGGTAVRGTSDRYRNGLSPRVRGNRPYVLAALPRLRSIPACAGEPSGDRYFIDRTKVYPRVCGGTMSGFCTRHTRRGLSPRVRGNLWPSYWLSVTTGSIPACAGEPGKAKIVYGPKEVYPRVCGGTPCNGSGHLPPMGLSPRVRGNRLGSEPTGNVTGSIPACAGEPHSPPNIEKVRQVYPRVCGGTARARTAALPKWGLSPRVRGNRVGVRSAIRGDRSIPACAGEPPHVSLFCGVQRVYPRVCGGTHTSFPPRYRMIGLSPRVRGNRDAA